MRLIKRKLNMTSELIDVLSRKILLDIFRQSELVSGMVDAISYRADHEDWLERLTQLENQQYLKRNGDYYRITLIALCVLDDPRVKNRLNYCEKIFNVLRGHYKNPKTRNQEKKIKDLAEDIGLTYSQTVQTICYFMDASSLWHASGSANLENIEISYVKPAESIITNKTFTDLIAKVQDWYEPKLTIGMPNNRLEWSTSIEEQKQPIVFISYSHDSPEHKGWVREFASLLIQNGVDVILDQWNLSFGDDVPKFMEKSVQNADRVLMICTETYVHKANDGKGGAGYEVMIVTGELIRDLGTSKFIPVVRQKIGASDDPILPKFMNTRFYVNLGTEKEFSEKFEELLRELHKVPKKRKPPIGKNPFAVESNQGSGNAASTPSIKVTPIKNFSDQRIVVPSTDETPTPNWPIRELFFNLRPSLRDGKDIDYEATSLEIKDKLSTGQLKSWGRLDPHFGNRQPLSEIDRTYWQHAEFTYFFLVDDKEHQRVVHATPDIHSSHMGLPEYRDLQVNSSQALKIWPIEKQQYSGFPVGSLSFADLGQNMIDIGYQINNFIEHESKNRDEEQLVNHYHTHYAPRVISLYEEAKRRGFSGDRDIDQYYQHPKYVVNVRHVAQRLSALGQTIKGYV